MMRNLLIATALLCCSALTGVAQSQPDKHAAEVLQWLRDRAPTTPA